MIKVRCYEDVAEMRYREVEFEIIFDARVFANAIQEQYELVVIYDGEYVEVIA